MSKEDAVSRICLALEIELCWLGYHERERDECKLQQGIEEVAAQFPTFGTRCITAPLKLKPLRLKTIGRKRARRLRKEMGLEAR